jgi:hypothetical protein
LVAALSSAPPERFAGGTVRVGGPCGIHTEKGGNKQQDRYPGSTANHGLSSERY